MKNKWTHKLLIAVAIVSFWAPAGFGSIIEGVEFNKRIAAHGSIEISVCGELSVSHTRRTVMKHRFWETKK